MAGEFYYRDYDTYFPTFSNHSNKVAEMMSHLNYQITEFDLAPVPSQELFRMTLDLMYYVDQSYKADHGISDQYEVLSFRTKDEMLDSMRSLLKEELDRYLGSSDAANQ
jgi:hypothetical protein